MYLSTRSVGGILRRELVAPTPPIPERDHNASPFMSYGQGDAERKKTRLIPKAT